MTADVYKLISIVIYMAAMVFIGWYAFRRTSNLTDYMLGGRSLGPAVTALSAGAADMSGWLLLGLLPFMTKGCRKSGLRSVSQQGLILTGIS